MELKSQLYCLTIIYELRSNRTFMELKYLSRVTA